VSWVYGLEKLVFVASIGYVFYLWPEAIATRQHVLAVVALVANLNNLPRAVVGARG